MPDTVGRPFALYALVAANTVSLLGNVVAAIAIPWFVLVTTGSAAKTGVAAFFTTLPLALGAFFGGAVADAIGHRRASIVGDLASATAVAAIPALHAADRLELPYLLALAFLGALFDAPAQAAREALLPDMAERARVPLDRANALWTSTEHTGYVLGAPVGGLLVATLGAPGALWVDAGSFALSALALTIVSGAAVDRTRGRYASELNEGLRYLAGNEMLRTFLGMAMVGNFLIAPLAPVLLPVYARTELGGARDLGLLIGAYGAGGVAGALGFALVVRRVARRRLYVTVWSAYPVASFVLVALPGLALTALTMFAIGLIAGTISPLEQGVRQEHTPAYLRGRIFATHMASLTLVIPPAMLAAGLLVDAAGLRAALLALAVGNTLLEIFAVTSRAARRL